jgi:hypothetical protein
MNASRHPLAANSPRLQKVGTVNVVVSDPDDVNKVTQKVHAYVRTIDRHGIVVININGSPFQPDAPSKPAKPAKPPRKKAGEESLLD